jgi:HEAT repeat protein
MSQWNLFCYRMLFDLLLAVVALRLAASPAVAGDSPGRSAQLPPPEPLPVPSQAETDSRLLLSAKVGCDGHSLLNFFERRTSAAENRGGIIALVQRLGDESFAVREKASADLLKCGPAAIPFLREAIHDADLERARRARQCLEQLGPGDDPVAAEAAVRALLQLAPPDAAATLLAYLPYAPDDGVTQAIRESLRRLLIREGKPDPSLAKAASDPQPARRAAAAYLLGLCAPDPRLLKRLLADPSPQVRSEAARALLLTGDRSALPVLLALLEEAPLAIAWHAQRSLTDAANREAPALPLFDSKDSRRACRAAWKEYWRRHPGAIIPRPPDFGSPGEGRIVLCDLDENRILVLDCAFKEQWRITDCEGPVDVQVLVNGHLLIAENHGERVTERDRWGRIVWEQKMPKPPLSCWRLPNGNTGIVTHTQAFEITPDGKRVWCFETPAPETLSGGQRLRDGHIMVWTIDKVIHLTSTGKEIKRGEVVGPARDGGPILVDGKPLWLCQRLGVRAVCLPDGHVLVCSVDSDYALIELDRKGKAVRKLKTEGRPWNVRFVP